MIERPMIHALSEQTFQRIGQFVSNELGIKMPPAKRTMLQGRLMKRLRRLEMKSYEAYCDYLFSQEGRQREMVHMLDAVTTNKTDFFREPKHFEILTESLLPELVRVSGAGIRRRLMVWSAGCSTGAEPYTLAMVLSEYGNRWEDFNFSILATDISTKVLARAREAIYTETEAKPIPQTLKKKYLLRSKDRSRQIVRIAPELRAKVQFCRLNFMDQHYGMHTPMDVIFCRNVLIYFDFQKQKHVLTNLCRHLRPEGYLFSGHSETLNGFNLPLHQVATTVYRKNGQERGCEYQAIA
jgi:chemotaxis protein methyltransferase CheR